MTQALLAAVLGASIRIAVVAGLVAILLFVLRVRASSVRHGAWTMVLGAMILMPVLPLVVPPLLAIDLPAPPVAFDDLTGAPPRDVHMTPPDATAPAAIVNTATASSTSLPSRGPAIPGQRLPWRSAIAALYAAGLMVMLLRIARGWRQVSRIASEARPIPGQFVESKRVSESSLVATPVTIGLLLPRVILPADWKTWPTETLIAVLAHEHAHRARRDPLIALMAQLNRALFWFHPLSWWLERTLTVTAEHASDDEALKAVGTSRGYVEVLLHMAETVRIHGGRMASQSVGVNGTGQLGERIDRILSGDVAHHVSRWRKATVAAICALVIALTASCREQAAGPLQEDPALAAELKARQERSDFHNAARKMTLAEAASLEETLNRNPEDTVTREKLLIFYRWMGDNIQDWNDNVRSRRTHALWLVEHRPDSELMNQARISKLADPIGYEQVRKLWLAHVAKPEVSIKVLDHAAWFFTESEKPVAERLLLRARTLQPDGPQPRVANGSYYAPWSSRLGELYARVLVGSVEESLGNVVVNTAAEAANSEYARQVREKLETMDDAAILGAAGRYLMFNARNVKVAFDHVALGRRYLQRAAQLDPQSVSARLLADLEAEDRGRPLLNPFGRAPRASWPELIAKLPEEERLLPLVGIAEHEYLSGENLQHIGRQPEADEAFHLAERHAREALALAPRFPGYPTYAAAIFRAHIALGLHALRKGDRSDAVEHLLEASKAPQATV